jgi:hypothetical protein
MSPPCSSCFRVGPGVTAAKSRVHPVRLQPMLVDVTDETAGVRRDNVGRQGGRSRLTEQ